MLQYCLDSIPVRDDVQVIVVDDNSDAGIVNFEEIPKWKGDDYVFVRTTKSGGTGYAENIGLDYAKGKWILFSGADDFFLPSLNNILYDELDTDADVVFFRPRAVMLNDRTSFSPRADYYNNIIERFFINGDETELRCRYFSVCSRLISRKMVIENNIRFDEIKYSNDNLFAVKIGVKAQKIVVRNQSIYCITESDKTLTSNFLEKPGELRIRTDAFFRSQKVVKDAGYPVDENTSLNYLRRLFSEDWGSFMLNFDRMRNMGYKKTWLIHNLFKNNSPLSRIKRTTYVFLKTGFK